MDSSSAEVIEPAVALAAVGDGETWAVAATAWAFAAPLPVVAAVSGLAAESTSAVAVDARDTRSAADAAVESTWGTDRAGAGAVFTPPDDRAERDEAAVRFAGEAVAARLDGTDEFGAAEAVPPSSARAVPVPENIAAPIPRATAKAPTRPTQ